MTQKGKKPEAFFRKDDSAIVIGTDAYVSHRNQNHGPWRSTFSLTIEEATQLRNQLTQVIKERSE